MFSSNRRQLRRWAERVLLLWVFGLSSGVASACWAGNMARLEGLQLPPAVAVKAVQGDGALPECALHSGVHPQDDAGTGGHEHSGAKTICNAYCDMSALSVSPLKSSLDHSPGPALPARGRSAGQGGAAGRVGLYAGFCGPLGGPEYLPANPSLWTQHRGKPVQRRSSRSSLAT